MVTAHGGGKNVSSKTGILSTSGMIHDTKSSHSKLLSEKGLEGLIENTTGVPKDLPSDGMIVDTIPSSMRSTPAMAVPMSERSKTVSKMTVGIPYSGPSSGYGSASKSVAKKSSKKK